jgi:hypothetical protein
MILAIGAVAVFVHRFIQENYQAILGVIVTALALWLGLKGLRWWMPWAAQKAPSSARTVQQAAAPTSYLASSPLPVHGRVSSPPPISSRVATPPPRPSANASGFDAARQAPANDSYSTPEVRIRPLADPPNAAGRAKAQGEEKARWIAPGEAVTIAGVTISDGMFYLGTPPPSSYLSKVEPCFVNPSLNVSKNRSPRNDPPTYWPSYSEITPSQRRGFLQWMANGRTDPNENLSLVFLFVYGLEYRLFKEGVTTDAAQLIAEAERLLAIYGRGSFSKYVGKFISFARAHVPNANGPALDFEIIPKDMPLDARIYLGRKLANGGAIQADDALIWAVSSPVAWRKRWLNDQRDVFEDLWGIRFASRFPAGLPIRIPKENIHAVYRASSGSFEVPVKGPFENFPDPSGDAMTTEALKALVDECWTEGGSYISAAARRPEGQSLPSAALLLPEDVWIKRNARLLKTLANYLEGSGSEALVLPTTEVFNLAEMSVSIAPKTLLAVLRRLSEGLRTVDVGLEPDGNYADADVSFASLVCLFKLPESCRGSGYVNAVNVGARTIIDIALYCAMVAENDDAGTRAQIAATIAVAVDADELERTRLGAYASVSAPSPERQPRLLRSASQLSTQLRETAARASIVGVTSAKRLPVQVVRHLEKVHRALNLPTDDIYAALHRTPAEDTTPIAAADPTDVAFEAVRRELENQSRPAVPAKVIAIDQERLAHAREATQVVSKVLSEIFKEADASGEDILEPSHSIDKTTPADAGPFEGLDASHGTLLAAALDAGPLPRAEFERLAKSKKLFADGAIDHINEWGFDRFDEPVVDDGGEVSIAPHLIERVKELRDHRE